MKVISTEFTRRRRARSCVYAAFATAVIQTVATTASPAQPPTYAPTNICELEGAQFNYERELAQQVSGEQNALVVSDIKDKLVQSRKKQSVARLNLFSAKLTSVTRNQKDIRSTPWTGNFIQGRSGFSDVKLQILALTAPYLDVFNLKGLVICPNTKLHVVLTVDFAVSDLSPRFSKIGQFVPEYPTSDLNALKPVLRGLKPGDIVSVTGYASLFLYRVPTSSFDHFIQTDEQIPPESPQIESRSDPVGIVTPQTQSLSLRTDEEMAIIYQAKLTNITK